MQISRRHVALAAASVFAFAATPAGAQIGAPLDGAWQGVLTSIRGRELSVAGGDWEPFRLVILRDTVRVFLREENSDEFEEIKPGAFSITRLGNSAIIAAIDSAPAAPLGEGWVESWSFSVTQKAEHTLSCVFTRQVNNHQVPHGGEGATFSMVLSGELQRVYVDHV
jgi:hypothetical protein